MSNVHFLSLPAKLQFLLIAMLFDESIGKALALFVKETPPNIHQLSCHRYIEEYLRLRQPIILYIRWCT